MDAAFTILAGFVSLIGASIPVYFAYKKAKKAANEKVTIAKDNPKLHSSVSDRVHERLKSVRNGISDGKEGQ